MLKKVPSDLHCEVERLRFSCSLIVLLRIVQWRLGSGWKTEVSGLVYMKGQEIFCAP